MTNQNRLFYNLQANETKMQYRELLIKLSSLSRLYSESDVPFLYYRTMENIFCLCFNASNLSRSDVSIDAKKEKLGIGLKTFLHDNGNTFQKIAEFNKESYLFENLSDDEIILKVSNLRNKRLEVTKEIYDVDKLIYHIISRKKNKLLIYEEIMDPIKLERLVLYNTTNTTIRFDDGISEYNFNKSKSTLFKRFKTNEMELVDNIDVKIIEEPFNYLLELDLVDNTILNNNGDSLSKYDYIVLPLYSYQSKKVEKKSGLNIWASAGRKRDENEVYIPIPTFLHDYISGFFPYRDNSNNTDSFDVKLPNEKILSMKITQAGGKALQSNPNKDLGKWILRDILKLSVNTIVTKEMLDEIGIDSIKLTKINDGFYLMDFMRTGSFEEFIDEILKL